MAKGNDSLVRLSKAHVEKVAALKTHLGVTTNKEALEWIVDNATLLASQGSLSPTGSDVLSMVRSVARTSAANARGLVDLKNALMIVAAALAALIPETEWPETPEAAVKSLPKLLAKVLEGD